MVESPLLFVTTSFSSFPLGSSQRKSRIATNHVPRALNTIKHEELKTIALLGCGGFGAVTLEQHKSTGQTYALKRLSKGYIVKTKMQQGIRGLLFLTT